MKWTAPGLVWRCCVAALMLAVAACATLAHNNGLTSAGGEVLRGQRLENRVWAFYGIPYAAAPIGELRWRAPQPHAPRSGTQDATRFGPACPQDQGNPNWYRKVAVAMGAAPNVVPPLTAISEDCLFLNVWTPSADRSAGAGLPVMVWIHGGSNVNGFAYEPNYLGHRLAARGVVVVSLNYRLGLLGFFAHPALGDDGSGRQGILDQAAALRWVRTNIAAFGGDPQRVTVFGESAGGTNIAALLGAPEARGLFQRAIVQSGYLAKDAFVTLAQAREASAKVFDTSVNAKGLRALTWEDLLQVQSSKLKSHFYAPVSATKPDHRVAIMIGSNRDEERMYLPADIAAAYREALEAVAPTRRAAVAALLARLTSDPKTRLDYLNAAKGFFCPTRVIADEAKAAGQAAFVYLFTRVRPGTHDLGAYHGAEIPYAFGTSDAWLPHAAKDDELTDVMMRYWVNFAVRGDPNGVGLARWPAWDGHSLMELGDRQGVVHEDAFALCALIEES